MAYANKPATIDELRTNIEHEITAVSADLCMKKKWVQRLDFCKRARSGHAKEIAFHSKWHLTYFTGIQNLKLLSKTVLVLFIKAFVALLLKNPL